MIDKNIIKKIVSLAQIQKNETVLEIGAGKGFLTKELAKKARKVIAIEIDPKMKQYLKMDKVDIVIGNALDILTHSSRKNIHFDKIISNIPYSISEALINKLIFTKFKLAILTVPKRFAYILKTKQNSEKFSKLSILAQTFYDIEILFDVPKEAFEPKPKVNSVVISLRPKREKCLEKLIFLQPKRLVKNALREALCDYKKMTKSEARKAIKSFESYNLLSKKVIELTTQDWKKMVINLKKYNK